MNIESFEATEALKNGATVKIRAVQPDDKDRISEAFSGLSLESVYMRFFRSKSSLSDQELKAATEVDFDNVVALVATITSGTKETIVAGGRYAVINRSAAAVSAEVAFLVEEDFQRLGIARRLLNHLAHIAREHGVSQFEADVLAQNQAMLSVFSESGLRAKQHSADGVVHVTISLAGS